MEGLTQLKALYHYGRLHTTDMVSSVYEFFFVRSQEECLYFDRGYRNFGVMLKGKSLEQLPKYSNEFKHCFLVNNFDKEIQLIGNSLIGKKCVPFVNRKDTAYLYPENYKKLKVTDVQLPKVSDFADSRLRESRLHYESLGLKTHFLPKKLLEFNKLNFGREYSKKYPNTGIMAIIYALEMLGPETLWIAGLDFYQSDYLARRAHQNPLVVQQAKMERTNLVKVTSNIFRRYPNTQINMISYYKGFPDVPNVTILS